jgi:hypothetical protein
MEIGKLMEIEKKKLHAGKSKLNETFPGKLPNSQFLISSPKRQHVRLKILVCVPQKLRPSLLQCLRNGRVLKRENRQRLSIVVKKRSGTGASRLLGDEGGLPRDFGG